MVTSFIANDIECDGCANSIKKALAKKEGINSVAVDVLTKTVLVTYDNSAINTDAIKEELLEIGFPAKEIS